ncbi:MAG: methyltransferase domain-containing protein [Deltaproteobacteria bacterium]|nr:methyltransferase domain-containing protein [Deltaproteobacteria bacterium]
MIFSEKHGNNNGNAYLFFKGFLKQPKQVGSVIPSSGSLERRLVRMTNAAEAKTIVELGPGTGGTTKALLSAMKVDARLLCIEINPDFSAILKQMNDERLIVYEGNACSISEAIDRNGLPSPDVVLSGIPFSTMAEDQGVEILQSVHRSLAPGGCFVAYQVRDRVELLARSVFGECCREIELWNLPPLQLFRWEKNARTAT